MRKNIIESIDNGCLIVNYTGHGGIDLWAHERIFQVEDILLLSNRHKLPFFFAISCSSGMFQHPERESMAEKLVKAENRGAIASWVATGSLYIDPFIPLGQEFFKAFNEHKDCTIGSIIEQTILGYMSHPWYDTELLKEYTFFGDPALKFNNINKQAPFVKIYANGRSVLEGDYLASIIEITAEVNAFQNIDINSIQVIINDQKYTEFDYLPQNKNSGMVNFEYKFEYGAHEVRIFATDSTGVTGEDRIFFHVADELEIKNVLNYPNPMQTVTNFTFILNQPAEVSIKIYTVAGRLIQVLHHYADASFNSIKWHGFDKDGDKVANGVYFYKIIAKSDSKKATAVETLVKME